MTALRLFFGALEAGVLAYFFVMGLAMVRDPERWKSCRFFVRGALDELDIRNPGDRFRIRTLGVLFCGLPAVVAVWSVLLLSGVI